MTFANPAGNAAAAAPAYVRALLDILGDREPLEVMPELVPWIEQRLRGMPDAALRRPEAPGKWSVVEVVQHLADVELVYGFRGRLVLSEDRPTIRASTRIAGPALFRYREAPAERALGAARGAPQRRISRLWRTPGGPAEKRAGRPPQRTGRRRAWPACCD